MARPTRYRTGLLSVSDVALANPLPEDPATGKEVTPRLLEDFLANARLAGGVATEMERLS